MYRADSNFGISKVPSADLAKNKQGQTLDPEEMGTLDIDLCPEND